MNKYFPIIGLEIHVELNTKSKMFCQCSADYFNKKPNSVVCPVCLGLPGALPVPNKKAIEYTQFIAKALNCKLNQKSKFDRKHYFYPDLPKGYQISQYDQPFANNGFLLINNKKFRIQRVHLEEDAGKLIHKSNATYVDFNRAGVPLVEIVTKPDFDNSTDIKDFLEYLHLLIQQYLKVSNANMEEGSMRLEPNISLTQKKGELPDYKIEVKNINSFKFVKKAVDFEIDRQTRLLNKNVKLKNETRGYDENKAITFSQRTKEEAKDYRYFPEPDIPPFTFLKKDLDQIKLPELPDEKLQRYKSELKLTHNQALLLIKDVRKAELFEKLTLKENSLSNAGKIANFIINRAYDKNMKILEPEQIDKQVISKAIKVVLKSNQKAVNDYSLGKENALFFILGQVIRVIGKNINIKELKSELIKQINSIK
ncbi:hypothetical protein A3F29_01685 [Candidatus Roizmanbacteria bacterium RIFCSPHIGHO2_12_FULL_33_9]|uniref:Aspartyl/glutamyl-tRNA(Asn/Gln) amidotransferase subunit B n=1 Tax=Candidatus Roizmanbacteria bacterium RIFCSPHIGHO2_12_FULL_33_9 TaxID=1802045 RepID=A0A1F7HIY4_9BACT|nr:MAG: hypothetical protein A3F29_01685 [Candidatus Roizmanbacteria bacterium RIFCSPHIGHO2_12_FULL_33_9]